MAPPRRSVYPRRSRSRPARSRRGPSREAPGMWQPLPRRSGGRRRGSQTPLARKARRRRRAGSSRQRPARRDRRPRRRSRPRSEPGRLRKSRRCAGPWAFSFRWLGRAGAMGPAKPLAGGDAGGKRLGLGSSPRRPGGAMGALGLSSRRGSCGAGWCAPRRGRLLDDAGLQGGALGLLAGESGREVSVVAGHFVDPGDQVGLG
jgi:hypothetical protein